MLNSCFILFAVFILKTAASFIQNKPFLEHINTGTAHKTFFHLLWEKRKKKNNNIPIHIVSGKRNTERKMNNRPEYIMKFTFQNNMSFSNYFFTTQQQQKKIILNSLFSSFFIFIYYLQFFSVEWNTINGKRRFPITVATVTVH